MGWVGTESSTCEMRVGFGGNSFWKEKEARGIEINHVISGLEQAAPVIPVSTPKEEKSNHCPRACANRIMRRNFN